MITLLIVSLVLAAMAPMMSKKAINESSTVPAGAILSFAGRECPNGWKEANGSNGTLDLRGLFIRAWDHGRGIDPERELHSFQEDDFKSHNHGLRMSPNDSGFGNSVGSDGWGDDRYINTSFVQNAGGDETRPKNIALIMCQKM